MTLQGAHIVVLALALAGCATHARLACRSGEAQIRTAQLFVGSRAAPVSDVEVRRFVAREVTPRFPDGVTIVSGGRKWTGEENRRIREAGKIVLIVLPADRQAETRMESLRKAYRARFRQPPVVVVPPPACVAL